MFFKAVIFFLTIFLPAVALAELPKTIPGKNGSSKMVLIPEGTFFMGSNDDDIKDVAPFHEPYIDAFYMDVYEATNEQFVMFLNDSMPREGVNNKRWSWVVIRNDLETENRFTWWPTEIIYEDRRYVALEGYKRHPVVTVSWYAADAYCKWVEKRLPTEAEWEKAARGGLKKKRFPWGDEIPTGGMVFDKVWRDNMVPAPTGNVGNYYPNGYGLFDMAGNVWEWVSDWFNPDYYMRSPDNNPQGPKTGELKSLRGGAWHNMAMDLRVAIRNTEYPLENGDAVGFRCAKDATNIRSETAAGKNDDAEN
jgi:formylglycine-generating enzyme required for sulfatase activity